MPKDIRTTTFPTVRQILFVVLNIPNGNVILKCREQHRYQPRITLSSSADLHGDTRVN